MADDDDVDLTDISQFAVAIHDLAFRDAVAVRGMHCVTCGGVRRMHIVTVHWSPVELDELREHAEFARTGPALFRLTCVACHTSYDGLVHHGPAGPELAIFSAARGGLTTPNTPLAVSYYLDQAHRSESVGGTSAAAAMYRSALEMLLFEQKYTSGMLNSKIEKLLADDNPPAWRSQVDPEYLGLLKDIANAVMHPNDGDIARQAAVDRGLLVHLRLVFEEFLDVIYERPAATAGRKSKLRAALDALTPGRSGTAAGTTGTSQTEETA